MDIKEPSCCIQKKFHLNYRPEIDGLRALAVLSVVIYHAFPGRLQGGFIGVDIFFVISGFLISTIILKNLELASFSFTDFYARRVKRIFPALLIVLVSTLIFGWYILLTNEYQQLGKHVMGGSGFVSNLVLWGEASYFDNSSETKPLLHLWSLGIEEQFYIFWPLLLYGFWKLKQLSFGFSIGILLLISLVTCLYLSYTDITAAFYSPISRFWELLVGSLLAWYTLIGAKEPKEWQNNIYAIIGLSLICYTLFFIPENAVFPGGWALLPVFGTALIILAGSNNFVNRIFLANSLAVWFGAISYTLYLWHWPLLSYAQILAGGSGLNKETKVTLVLTSILLAWLTYWYIEKPIRYGKYRYTTFPLISGMCILFLLGTLIHKQLIEPRLNSPETEKIINAIGEWTYPEKGFVKLKKGEYEFYTLNSENFSKTVYFGDSNMNQYSARIHQLILNNPSETNTAIFSTADGCKPILHITYLSQGHGYHCKDYMRTAIRHARTLKNVDKIVIAAAWTGPLASTNKSYNIEGTSIDNKNIDLLYKALSKTFQELKSITNNVYLVLDIPRGDALDPASFLEITNRLKIKEIEHIKTFEKEHSRSSIFNNKTKLARKRLIQIAQQQQLFIIDPIESLCSKQKCQKATIDGNPIYKDGGHLRPSYVKEHVKYLDSTIKISN